MVWGGRKRQDRQGGKRTEAEVMDSNEMKCWGKKTQEQKDFCFLSIKTRVKQQLRGPVWLNTINKRPQGDTPPHTHTSHIHTHTLLGFLFL